MYYYYSYLFFKEFYCKFNYNEYICFFYCNDVFLKKIFLGKKLECFKF